MLSLVKKLAREPLVHFLLLGALIFAINAWRERQRPAKTETARIEITAGTIARLSEGFANQWHRAPNAAELRGMVNDHVREEVLYREALALGLDGNDTIVRRRLAQKMEFLGQDIATAVPPNEIALRKFFGENASHYAQAARLSFQHIYFSKEKRGDQLDANARAALAALANGASDDSVGDPFLRESEFSDANQIEISGALGREFAVQVMTLPTGDWRGPVTSSYGMHLVRISRRSEPQAVEFESVRDAVARDFSEQRRLAANNDFISRLKQRYLISIDEAALNNVAAPSTETAMR
jgi:peptidyl-prolyl cis-trans isomerase C